MKLLHKAQNSIERDALIIELDKIGIHALSPEKLELLSVNMGGMSALENKYSIYVEDEDFERATHILNKFQVSIK